MCLFLVLHTIILINRFVSIRFISLATAPETVSPPIMGYTPPSSSILETILTGNRVVSGKKITPPHNIISVLNLNHYNSFSLVIT